MNLPFNSRRSPVYARHGMVSSSQPLASEIGMRILKQGGNAADASVAVSAALNVTQPTSTGIGGDCFALYYNAATKEVKGLNASGRCSEALSIEILESMGYNEQNRPDPRHALWVTVPGAAAGWVDTIENFGSGNLTLAQILEPAINLAEEGFPVSDICSYHWTLSENLIRNASPGGVELLINGTRAPQTGEIFRNPTLANTFRLLGQMGKSGFYEGEIAEKIVASVSAAGGRLTLEDLRQHVNTFEEPIHVKYRGYDIYECPPSGQGITALLALNILEGFQIGQLQHNSKEHLHLVIESLRLAFADARFYVADPEFSDVPINGMINKVYAALRRSLIRENQAIDVVEHGFPPTSSNTVYFCVVDGSGNACSFINSNYMGFGTGIVPTGCGFTLHNRGDNFSLDTSHRNSLEPKKRPYHTIIPGLALRSNGDLFCPFGVMGGYMQPQGHLQVISNMIDFNMNPQEALDSPRVQISDGEANAKILLEEGITEQVRQALEDMGHNSPEILSGSRRIDFGMGQIITREPSSGVLCGGSDPRADGMAIPW